MILKTFLMINIVSFQPDIPQNLGAIIRLTACFDVPLSIIEPCGFPLGHKALRRVSMDYHDKSRITLWKSWENFLKSFSKNSRMILFTTKSNHNYNNFLFEKSDFLIFGRESSGVPDYVRDSMDYAIKIPLKIDVRSLNVVSAASIALSEALRQTGQLNNN